MKNIYFAFSILLSTLCSAQVVISDSTATNTNLVADQSAVLDLRSDDKGLLLPRPSQTPTTPVAGLLFYDTEGKCFRGYDGTSWQTLGADCDLPTVSFSATTISFDEPDELAEIAINYTNNSGSPVTISISPSTTPLGLSTEGATFDIPATPTSGVYNYLIEWTDNSTSDGNATFDLTLANSSNYNVGTNEIITVTLVDDDSPAAPASIEVLNIPETEITNQWSANFTVGSGTYVSNDYQGVRLGSGSKGGLMTYNSPITFSGATGTVIVTIDVKGWDSNEKSGIINVGNDSYQFTVNVDKSASTPETVTHTFTNVPTNSEVSFETLDMNGDERFIIYSILIQKQN